MNDKPYEVCITVSASAARAVPPHRLEQLASEMRALMAARLAGYDAGAVSAVSSGPPRQRPRGMTADLIPNVFAAAYFAACLVVAGGAACAAMVVVVYLWRGGG